MNVGVYNVINGNYEIVKAFVPLNKILPPDRIQEASEFLRETGRYWYKENGEPRYLTYVEG